MGEIFMRNKDLWVFHVRVNLPSPIVQVRVTIWRVITPIGGLPIPIRQVVPMITDVGSYPPYRSHLHPPSLSFSSTTLPSSPEHTVTLSLSISPCHHRELTLSAAFTEYSIHISLSGIPSFSRSGADPWMELLLPAVLLTDRLPPARSPKELQTSSHNVTLPRWRIY